MGTVLYGVLIGAFVTLIGGGGASLYLGVLVSQLGIGTHSAVATSLFVALPALFFGFVSQWRVKNVHFQLGNQLLFAAIPAILIGTVVSPYIPQKIYSFIVGGILIAMGIIVLWKFFRSGDSKQKKLRRPWVARSFGGLSGLMVGIGGLSGGATTAAGLAILGLTTVEAAGTSTYVLLGMSTLGFVFHLFNSVIVWKAGIGLMVGAIVGSVVTPLILSRLNAERINKILTPFLGIVIIYFGAKMWS